MTAAEIVVLRTYNDPFSAEVAKSALEAAGIASMIRSDDGGGQYPGAMGFSRGVELLVRQEDLRRASEIVGSTAELKD